MAYTGCLILPICFLLNKCAYISLFYKNVKCCQIKFFSDFYNIIRNINWKILDSGSLDSGFIFKAKYIMI